MKRERNERRLYNDLAHLWHLVSPLDDYLEETELISDYIKKESRRRCETLLHLGCGRGHNDFVFKRYFRVTGVDISPVMLKYAARLNPEATYYQGDMRTVDLGQTFDTVVGVDSVDYLTDYKGLQALFTNAYRHLNSGGVFLFILDVTKESFIQNHTTLYSNSSEDEVLTVIENKFDPDSSDTEYEMTFVYLYRHQQELEILTDRHLCGLFTVEEVKHLLTGQGFQVKVIDYRPPESAFGNQEPADNDAFPLIIGLKG